MAGVSDGRPFPYRFAPLRTGRRLNYLTKPNG